MRKTREVWEKVGGGTLTRARFLDILEVMLESENRKRLKKCVDELTQISENPFISNLRSRSLEAIPSDRYRARKVTQDDIDEWMELRRKGYSFKKIGEETGWNGETVRKHVREEQEKREKPREGGVGESELSLRAEAFKRFEDGQNWVDLVKNEICEISKAKDLWESWSERGAEGWEDVGDRLTEIEEGILRMKRTVSRGSVNFPREFREIMSTTPRGDESGITYAYGCYKAVALAPPETDFREIIKSLKMLISYFRARLEKG